MLCSEASCGLAWHNLPSLSTITLPLLLFPPPLSITSLLKSHSAAFFPFPSSSPCFNILILLKKICSVYVWAEINNTFGIAQVIGSCCVGLRACSPSCFFFFFFFASTHPANLSQLHNLPFSLHLPPNSVWCVSFCSLLLEASEFMVSLKTQGGGRRGRSQAWRIQ